MDTVVNSKAIEKVVYTPKDIQALLGIGKNQTYALVNSGEIPYVQVGATKLISKEVFDNWLRTGNKAS